MATNKVKLIEAAISVKLEMIKESINGQQKLKPTFTNQFTQRGAGCSVNRFINVDIIFGLYKPHKGGCRSIKLPCELANKKCLISPASDPNCCTFAVLACIHAPAHNPRRTSCYSWFHRLYDFFDVQGIVPVTAINKFCRKNNVSVNVYKYEVSTKTIWSIKVMDKPNPKHCNLLLHNDHYFAISNSNRLASNNGRAYHHFCHRCINSFKDEERLKAQSKDCLLHKAQQIILPESNSRNSYITRNDYRKESRFPYVIYGDFETLSVQVDGSQRVRADLVPVSFALVAVDWNSNIIEKRLSFGRNLGQKFFTALVEIKEKLKKHREENLMSARDEHEFENIENCHICGKKLHSDRDHFIGRFRGPAHQTCNVAYQVPSKIPVIFHNLRNFDGHIIINALRSGMFEKPPRLIPHTMEKYIAFILDDLVFLDNYSFLTSSLDNLLRMITKDIQTILSGTTPSLFLLVV
ncbi:uncharacterized protein LOC128385939 [Panonychus citri]|uniref:uncharacterized protein LOC128385939 n=1 Tax=Panonychus citri TaxID=50023 RepID=UPI0023081538|nr:uncharacterized protein LOC128385939 [Panonychus citri]